MAAVAALTVRPAALAAQELAADEAQRVAPYYRYWELAEIPEPASVDQRDRLNAAIGQARQEFGGRGPALARYFFQHVQASPGNTAFFFLFRAVGDVPTVQILIEALLDPPVPAGAGVGRQPEEVSIAIEAVLQNASIRTDPAVVSALDRTLLRARARLGASRVSEAAIHLLGKCGTAEATRRLQMLAIDPDPSIRAAAVEALGNTGSPAAGETLERTLSDDVNADARARAAASLARSESPGAVESLRATLPRERDPQVVDAIVSALTTRRALPVEPQACLAMANRCWEPSVAQPLFECWRAQATRHDLIGQAVSGGWVVRALALRTLTRDVRSPDGILREPAFEPPVRDRLLQSSVETLSRDISGLPAPDTLSYSTAQLARDALWEISGRNMSVALEFADRIVPISGRHTSVGRFGASYDLASKNETAYAAARRPRQLMAAGLAAIIMALLFVVKRFRKIAAALVVSVCVWTVWFSLHDGVRELPPLPLALFTASCVAFLTAGAVSGALAVSSMKGWLKMVSAAVIAAICAFVVCGVTRWAGLFPAEGLESIFEPLGSAMMAAPAAFAVSLGLVRWKA